ncbi:MAG: aa3-type cytochrome oxidase subunit III [Actinomycetes bacterium]
MARVSTASLAPPGASPTPANRPNMVSVGTIVWLSSELMFFAALFAMYFTIRSVSDVWPAENAELNIPFTAVNAIILVLSSVTCQIGVFAAERGDVRRLRKWFTITFVMGTVFVIGQVYEYVTLVEEGMTISAHPYGSVFYLLTGFHGMHVTGGLIAFLLVLARTFAMRRFTHGQATTAIVVSYYWHFVDVVWVGLYLTIYVIQ